MALRVTLLLGNTAPFEVMLQWWRVVGNTVLDFTGPRFEPQTSRSRDERVSARQKPLIMAKYEFLQAARISHTKILSHYI